MAVTITVEDGTGLETATSYIDLAYMQAYWEQYGYAYAATMTADQEMQLVNRSAVFLDGYKKDWGGYPINPTQALAFPRYELVDKFGNSVYGVPAEIKKAQALMAYYMDSSGVGNIAPVSNVNGDVKSYTDKVGLLTESKEYFEGTSSSGSLVRIPEIDALLKRFVTSKFGACNAGRMGGSDAGNYYVPFYRG